MKPAATSGVSERIVFQTSPWVSSKFNLPAINSAKKPSPEKDTAIRWKEIEVYWNNDHWEKNDSHL